MKRTLFTIIALLVSASVFAAKDTLILNVSSYGAKGDGTTDDLPALAKVFAKASRAARPVKITFDSGGVYRFAAHPDDFFSRLMLDRAEDVVVEGNGCTLMVHPTCRAFGIYDSKNIVIRNFKIDYSPLPYTQGRITAINNNEGWLEFKVDEGFPLPKTAGTKYYGTGKLADCVTGDGETLKFYQGHSKVVEVTKIGKKTYHVKYNMKRQYKARVNDIFAMKISYPSPKEIKNTEIPDPKYRGEYIVTGSGSIGALRCDGLLLENITSYASPVMTVNLKSCRNHVLRKFRIAGKDERLVASCSDGMHLKGNESQPVIEDCHIERTMDDAIHIKISGDIIKEVESPDRFRILHSDIMWDNTNLGKGLEIMIYDPDTKRQKALCRITDYSPVNYREGWVTVDAPVAWLKPGDMVYLQADGEAVIRRCTFGTQLQRAILTHQPTHIDRCVIQDNGKGIHMSFGTGLIEGPPTQKLRVTNTVFRNLVYSGIDIICPSHDYDQKGNPQLIVENCIFDMPDGIPVLNAKNSDGISLRNNTVSYSGILPDKKMIFRLEDSPLSEENNSYNTGWTKKTQTMLFPVSTVRMDDVIYRNAGGKDLHMYIYSSEHNADSSLPAMLFFHGGGWTSGEPANLDNQMRYLASRGIVCIGVQYRRIRRDGDFTVKDCISDAKHAYAWVIENAGKYNIDTDRIIMSGGSAGGHLALSSYLCDSVEPGLNGVLEHNPPAAYVLFNPVLDCSADEGSYGHDKVKDYWQEVSPVHNHKKTAEAIMFYGSNDKMLKAYDRFKDVFSDSKMSLQVYPSQGHGFFNLGRGGNYIEADVISAVEGFLCGKGFIAGPVQLPDLSVFTGRY